MRRFSVCVLVMSWCSMMTGTVDAQYDPRTTTSVPGGTLAARETWTAAQGSYHVVGSITIPAGGTLTIEPGVGVYLDAGVNVTVANGGRILAEGTEAREIQFARVPGAGSWGGLTINGGSNSPETRLAYLSFEGNGKTCIEVAGGTLYLDHAAFHTTTHQYVSLDGASFVLSRCYFPSGSGSFELVHGTGGIKAGGRGIVRDSFFGHTNGYSDAMDFTGGNREQNQPIIQYYHNVFMGSSDDGLDLDGTDAWIEGNVFLHCHRNGAPDSSAAISGGNDGSRTSEVTIIGNLIFDCDNAATAKQGNFFTFINNTIVHTTKEGGLDFDSGVVCCRDTTPSVTTFGKGFYLEGNIIVDAEKLVRNYDAKHTTVTWNNNILPMPWAGPGSGNRVADPQLKHIPAVSETYFTSWEEAQVLWDWFSLQAGSPGRGTGPNGADEGGVIPLGVSISGEPPATTSKADAILTVGIDRTGSGIPTGGFPLGSGFTSYRWRLDHEAWSPETPLAQPILLTGLAQGSHHVEVVGKNDAGLYQDDAALGTDAVVTISPTWIVDRTGAHLQINEVLAKNVSAVAHGDRYPGVVELQYDGLSDLDLSGMSITNDADNPAPFVFPAGTRMAPGQYLVLWADADTAAPGMHLGFTLSGDGDAVYLYDKNGALVDSVVFGRQLEDLSIGRVGYEDAWGLTVPTFGQMNLAVPLGDPNAVVINEWLAEGQVLFADGFIELYNPGSDPVDLGGMCLTDGAESTPAPDRVRPLSFVPGTGYAVVWAGEADDAYLRLSPAGGTIGLFNSQGEEIDEIAYGPQTADVSQGRAPDGAGELEYLALPTPGAANPGGKITITTTRTLVAEQADKRVLVPTGPVSDGWRGGSRTFDDSGWQLCTGGPGGVGYDTGSDYKPLISLDVQVQMHGSGKNNTCYIRVPFTLDANSLADVNELTLKMRSDDGFVAYLNGTEVARSNFTGTPAWNSHADSAIESTLGDFDEYADVSAFIGSLKPGANILAIHGMNSGTDSSDFLISTALDAVLWKVEDRSPPRNALDLLDGLRITELMYHAPAGNQYDYLELTNVSQKALDMNGVRLEKSVSFVFPALTLLPGACVVVAADVSAFRSTYGAGPAAVGPYQGDLDDAGGEIVLQLPAPFDAAVVRFAYSPTWYPSTDGAGESLVIRNSAARPVTWNDPASWQPSDPTPGQP
jgi:hypothetical protein